MTLLLLVGILSAAHIDADVQNVQVLWQSSAGLQVSGSVPVGLNDSVSNYDFLQGVCRAADADWYMPWAISTSKLSSSSVNLMGPSGLTDNDLVQFSTRAQRGKWIDIHR